MGVCALLLLKAIFAIALTIVIHVTGVPSFGGHYYRPVFGATTYAAALAASAAATLNGVRGHLVTITSAAENDFVTYFLDNSWIAVEDVGTEGTYKHSAGPENGTVVTYAPWAPDQPDNLNDEDCVVQWAYASLPNNWNDQDCTDLNPYVIEFECPLPQLLTIAGCQGESYSAT